MNFPMSKQIDVGGSAPATGGVTAQPVNNRTSMISDMTQQYMSGGGGGGQFSTQVMPNNYMQQYGQSMQGNIAPGGANATPVGFENMFPNVQQPGLQQQGVGQGGIPAALAQMLGLNVNGVAPGSQMNGVKPGLNGGNMNPNLIHALIQQLLGMR